MEKNSNKTRFSLSSNLFQFSENPITNEDAIMALRAILLNQSLAIVEVGMDVSILMRPVTVDLIACSAKT